MNKVAVSEYNELVNKGLKLPKRVRILDTTLRDGEQTPGVSFKKEEKIEIAEAVDGLGVDFIEAGFPINSQPEFDVVKEIAGMGLKAKVVALARVLDQDLDSAMKTECGMVHTFVSTSDIHLQYQMNKTRSEVKALAVSAVRKVKQAGFICLFSAMDATRTPMNYLSEVLKAVEAEGVDYINVPDTVGVMHPSAMRHFITEVKKQVKTPIDVHNHNDYGLAVANSLAAVEAGADGVQVTVNGMGERSGNASVEQVVMALHTLYGIKTNVKTEKLTAVSKLVAKYSEAPLAPFFPIVGDNAFAHESGIHAHAVMRSSDTFEPFPAEMVGQKSRIVIGKHSGKAAIEATLKTLGYEKVDQKLLVDITNKIKELAESKKRVYDEDVVAVAEDILGYAKKEKPLIIVDEVSVMTGNKITPTASVVLRYGNDILKGAAQGVGPVDAASNAIRQIVGNEAKIVLKEYNLRAITGGTDALADVTIKIENEKGRQFVANAVKEDIVMASVEALIRAVNDAVREKHKQEKK
ncbi:2-isopropylmalate synthase [Candidatus Gugararchaeum adminiculabundum]|nr:2-isopropylmalate synthase [Candidatus Gugararchaeum adminiculabundum]